MVKCEGIPALVIIFLLLGLGADTAHSQRLGAYQPPEKTAVLQGKAYLNYPGANAGFSTQNYPIKVVATNPEMTKRYGYAVVGQAAPRHEYSMHVKVPGSDKIVLHAYYDHRKFPPAIAEPVELSVSDGQEKEIPSFSVNFVDHPKSSSIEDGAGALLGVMSAVKYYYEATSYDERISTVKKTIQQLEQLEGWPPSVKEHGSSTNEELKGYELTSRRYPETADLREIVRDQYGSSAEIADWSDIKSRFSSSEIDDWADRIGLSHKGKAWVQWNGDRWHSGGGRHYFIKRHDGDKSGNFLAHDDIGGHIISLGSWHGQRNRILVDFRNIDQ